MNAKLQNTPQPEPQPWTDPDDAPDLADDFFEQGDWKVGEQPISKQEGTAALCQAIAQGRPKLPSTKRALTVRYDVEVIEAFKATGTGWQTRMNAALRDWLKNQSPA
jgi:uncharacterized protein (DUF4415 family)